MGRSVHDPVVQAWSGTVLYSIVPDDQGMAAVNVSDAGEHGEGTSANCRFRSKDVCTRRST
jgi:hypothetical protein